MKTYPFILLVLVVTSCSISKDFRTNVISEKYLDDFISKVDNIKDVKPINESISLQDNVDSCTTVTLRIPVVKPPEKIYSQKITVEESDTHILKKKVSVPVKKSTSLEVASNDKKNNTTISLADYESKGDVLMNTWSNQLNNKTLENRSVKRSMKIYGALTTCISSIGAILVPVFSDKQQKYLGVGVSVSGIILGLTQIINSGDSKIEEYLNDSLQAIQEWELSNKGEAAYKAFRKCQLQIRIKYSDLAL